MIRLVFITSGDIEEFCSRKREEGYKIVLDCDGLYSHYCEVDEENKEVRMVNKDEKQEYEVYQKEGKE